MTLAQKNLPFEQFDRLQSARKVLQASSPEQAEQQRNDRILEYAKQFRRNMAEGQRPAVIALLQQLDGLPPLELMKKLEDIGGWGFSVFQGYDTVLVCREYSEKLHQPDTELREKMRSFEAQLRNVLPRIRRILEIMRDEILLWDDAMEIEKAEIAMTNELTPPTATFHTTAEPQEQTT